MGILPAALADVRLPAIFSDHMVVQAGKPVLNAEYATSESSALTLGTQVCPESQALGLNTLVLPLELDGSFRVACGPIFTGE